LRVPWPWRWPPLPLQWLASVLVLVLVSALVLALARPLAPVPRLRARAWRRQLALAWRSVWRPSGPALAWSWWFSLPVARLLISVLPVSMLLVSVLPVSTPLVLGAQAPPLLFSAHVCLLRWLRPRWQGCERALRSDNPQWAIKWQVSMVILAMASGSQSKNFWNGPPTGCPGGSDSGHELDARSAGCNKVGIGPLFWHDAVAG
jgi:hypothetical protein